MKFALWTGLTLWVLSTSAVADPIFGLYETGPGDQGGYAHVEIYRCDTEICGVIRKAFDDTGGQVDSEDVGKRMIWGMRPVGEGRYARGKIWAPDRDRTYGARMELTGAALKVSGCILGICRGQTWSRIE